MRSARQPPANKPASANLVADLTKEKDAASKTLPASAAKTKQTAPGAKALHAAFPNALADVAS